MLIEIRFVDLKPDLDTASTLKNFKMCQHCKNSWDVGTKKCLLPINHAGKRDVFTLKPVRFILYKAVYGSALFI
jgi:hypothetical protein